MLIVYHSQDHDGHCGGAVVQYLMDLPKDSLLPLNYGDPIPWPKLVGQSITMVDFSLQPFSNMVELNKLSNLIWVDHHQKALDDHATSGVEINGLRRDGIGACQLAWEFFSLRPIPRIVKAAARWDVWDHDDEVINLHHGLNSYITDPSDHQCIDWPVLFQTDDLNKLIERGKIIREYSELKAKQNAKDAFEVVLDGHKFLAINRIGTSQILDSVYDPAKHEGRMLFNFDGKKWRVSVFSTQIDVGEIAKKFGGGGHVGAAGFQIDSITGII